MDKEEKFLLNNESLVNASASEDGIVIPQNNQQKWAIIGSGQDFIATQNSNFNQRTPETLVNKSLKSVISQDNSNLGRQHRFRGRYDPKSKGVDWDSVSISWNGEAQDYEINGQTEQETQRLIQLSGLSEQANPQSGKKNAKTDAKDLQTLIVSQELISIYNDLYGLGEHKTLKEVRAGLSEVGRAQPLLQTYNSLQQKEAEVTYKEKSRLSDLSPAISKYIKVVKVEKNPPEINAVKKEDDEISVFKQKLADLYFEQNPKGTAANFEQIEKNLSQNKENWKLLREFRGLARLNQGEEPPPPVKANNSNTNLAPEQAKGLALDDEAKAWLAKQIKPEPNPPPLQEIKLANLGERILDKYYTQNPNGQATRFEEVKQALAKDNSITPLLWQYQSELSLSR